MYLLDTNICIDFVDGRSLIARDRVRQNYSAGLSVSSITAAELLVGPAESEDPKGDKARVEQFLGLTQVVDFDLEAANSYANLVQRVGMRRRSFDRLIAAHALARGLVLVTNDLKHFADVPGLMVENWAV